MPALPAKDHRSRRGISSYPNALQTGFPIGAAVTRINPAMARETPPAASVDSQRSVDR